MDKKFIEKQKNQLIEQKEKLEEQLGSFAKESEQKKGDWDAKMPMFDAGKSLEEEADEVEEFGTRLALENTLENEVKKINIALEKIKEGKYGICEKCERKISLGRLEVYPQAELCKNCH